MSVIARSIELLLSEEIHTFSLLSEFEVAMLREKVKLLAPIYSEVEDLRRDFY